MSKTPFRKSNSVFNQIKTPQTVRQQFCAESAKRMKCALTLQHEVAAVMEFSLKPSLNRVARRDRYYGNKTHKIKFMARIKFIT